MPPRAGGNRPNVLEARDRSIVDRLDEAFAVLDDRGEFPAGANEAVWEGHDATARLVPRGICFLRATAMPGLSANTRVLLLR